MKVAVFPADEGGCGYYRMRFPALAAKSAGLDVEIRTTFGKVRTKQGRFLRLAEAPDYDVAVLQRPFGIDVCGVIPLLQAAGVAVVVDMDDDASTLPPGHAAFAQLHPKWSPEHNWHNAEMACGMADLVTVSTPLLRSRYGAHHDRVVVLRNCIPEEYLSVTPSRSVLGLSADDRVLGWTGALAVHPGDVEVTRMGVANGLPADWRFLAAEADPSVSEHRDEAHRRFGIPSAQRVVAPWTDLRDGYPHLVASLDVGLAPLALNRFNECKSALRGLEYAAMGVPFVASATGEYRLMAERFGVGRIAEKPKDWTRHLRELCGSADLRAEEAGRGRELAASLTYESQADYWIQAWTAAREIADAANAAAGLASRRPSGLAVPNPPKLIVPGGS